MVARQADVDDFAGYAPRYGISKLKAVVVGGDTRQQSVQRGLVAVDEAATLVAVHDGARPLILPEEIERIVAAAEEVGGATAAVPVKDTVKLAREDGTVAEIFANNNAPYTQPELG